MYCKKCNNLLNNGESFCHKCGVAVNNNSNASDSMNSVYNGNIVDNNIQLNSINSNQVNNGDINNQKSRVLAIFLYLLFAPLCLGDLYLGYNKRFIHQMLRYFGVIISLVLTSMMGKNNILGVICFCLFIFCGFSIFIIMIINYIKAIRIFIGNIVDDSNGNKLI